MGYATEGKSGLTMQNLKLAALLLLSIATLTACGYVTSLGFNPVTKEEALKVDGSVQILSITKLVRPDKEDPTLTAIKNLKTKITDKDMIEAGSINGFIGLTKKDPDIAPQQVEKITWQEGQPPQTITLKAW